MALLRLLQQTWKPNVLACFAKGKNIHPVWCQSPALKTNPTLKYPNPTVLSTKYAAPANKEPELQYSWQPDQVSMSVCACV